MEPYKPQLPTLAKAAPDSEDWAIELKADGFRMGCRIEHGRARLESRHAKDWSSAYSMVTEAALKLPLRAAMIDGEVAVLTSSGLTSFQALQNYRLGSPGLIYVAFDLLHLDGENIRKRPLEERKIMLQELLRASPKDGVLRFGDHIVGQGPRVFAEAKRLGAEGIVAKRLRSPYTEGRSRDWLKVKCTRVESFIVGGFTEPAGSRAGLGALLLGYYDAEQRLIYAGSVGTGQGFTQDFLAELRRQLNSLALSTSPFFRWAAPAVRSQWGKRRSATTHWVTPLLVVEVAYLEWTEDGQLRHPTFQGFRPDVRPLDVRR